MMIPDDGFNDTELLRVIGNGFPPRLKTFSPTNGSDLALTYYLVLSAERASLFRIASFRRRPSEPRR